jgi:hypothetical protein
MNCWKDDRGNSLNTYDTDQFSMKKIKSGDKFYHISIKQKNLTSILFCPYIRIYVVKN